MLLGASNSWFPITLSVLSLPVSSDPIEQIVAEHWAVFSEIPNRENLDFALKFVPQIKGSRTSTETLSGRRSRRARRAPRLSRPRST